MTAAQRATRARMVGRYAIYQPIASGGMATVHLGRLVGAKGFTRTVAIKRLHEVYTADPEFVAMFIDEARLAARVRHPNVLQTLDLLTEDGELLLVFEYVQGRTLAELLQLAAMNGARIPHRITSSIISGVLQGLHAAHDARDEHGRPLGLVHRDVSPQNILLGLDGLARVLDFGIAKAEGRLQMTRDGQVKGKLGYIAPEQIEGGAITHRADIYSASVVLWEALTGKRLVEADTPASMVARTLQPKLTRPTRIVPGLPAAYDEVVLRGMNTDPELRFASAREMAFALEACDGVESNAAVGAWLENLLGATAEAIDEELDIDTAVDELMDAGVDEGPTEQIDPLTQEMPRPSALLDLRLRSELLSASDWELTRPDPRSKPEVAVAPPAAPAVSPFQTTQPALTQKHAPRRDRSRGSRWLLALDAMLIIGAAVFLSLPAVRNPGALSSASAPAPSEPVSGAADLADAAVSPDAGGRPAVTNSTPAPSPKAPRRRSGSRKSRTTATPTKKVR